VESAALASSVPLGGFGGGTSHVAVEGFVPPAPEGFEAERAVVSPRYFETLRIPLIEGRDFLPSDDASAARVAVVNETLAARFWPGRSALSHRLRVDGTDVEIVGVVKAGKYRSLAEEPRLAVTLPIAQAFRPRMTVLLRTAPGASVTKELREIVRGLDPDLPVLDTMLVSDFIAVSFLPQRMAGAVTTALGLLGVALASVGLYGVVSYAVGRRTKEIGIRMALGARPADVLTLVLRQTAVLAGVGILAGGLLGIGASRLLTGLLFGVAPGDPFAVAAAALLLVIVTLAASAAPARRALGVNPLRALRTE
jgi:predicted permease